MISIQSYKLDEMAADLNRRKSHIEIAMRRASASFVRLVQSRVLDVVRAKVGLPKAQMSQFRINTKVERARMRAELWVGSSPIQVRYLNTRFTKKGVKAGGTLYPRSFMPWKNDGKSVILQRTGSDRLPVIAPEVDINDIVLETIEEQWIDLEQHFDRMVMEELSRI